MNSLEEPYLKKTFRDHGCLFVEFETSKGVLVSSSANLLMVMTMTMVMLIAITINIMTMTMMLMMSKVTGGQGADDEVLGSAEFFDLSTQQWTMVIVMMISDYNYI